MLEPGDAIVGNATREWHLDEARARHRCDIATGQVDVKANEIDRSTDHAHIPGGDLWGVHAGSRQEGLAVAAFHHRGQVGGIELADGEFGCRDMLGGFDHRNADG